MFPDLALSARFPEFARLLPEIESNRRTIPGYIGGIGAETPGFGTNPSLTFTRWSAGRILTRR